MDISYVPSLPQVQLLVGPVVSTPFNLNPSTYLYLYCLTHAISISYID